MPMTNMMTRMMMMRVMIIMVVMTMAVLTITKTKQLTVSIKMGICVEVRREVWELENDESRLMTTSVLSC